MTHGVRFPPVLRATSRSRSGRRAPCRRIGIAALMLMIVSSATGTRPAHAAGFGDRVAPGVAIARETLAGAESLGFADSVAIPEAIITGRFAEAESLARRSLERAEGAFGPNSLEVISALDWLVEALWQAGKSIRHESQELAERAVQLRERIEGPEGVGVARSLTNLAWVRFHSGDYASARTLFERALRIRENALGPQHLDVASSLRNLAVVLAESGFYAESRPLYERALAIRTQSLGSEHPTVANNLSDLGILLQYMGDPERARQLLERALAIREKAYGPAHPYVASSLTNLGNLLSDGGDFSAARPLYERGLSILEQDYGPDHFETAGALEGLGLLLAKIGDGAGARKYLERSLAVRERVWGPFHPNVALSLSNLGHLLLRMGETARAESLLERAWTVRVKTLGSDHPDVAHDLLQLAALKASRGDSLGAFGDALHAEEIARKHVRLMCRTLPEIQALRYAAARNSGLDLAISLSLGPETGSVAETWNALIRSRALVLDEMAARHRSWGSAEDTATVRILREWQVASQRLSSLVVQGLATASPLEYVGQLESAREEQEIAERALAEHSSPFRARQARGEVDLSLVEAALEPGDALLAFAQYHPYEFRGHRRESGAEGDLAPGDRRGTLEPAQGSSYVAFVLRGGGSRAEMLALGSADTIDSLVVGWSQAVARSGGGTGSAGSRAEARYRAIAARLRRAVWDPVAARVAGARRLFVVPDGSLHLVNLASLPSETGGYLVELDPVIHYLSAERDLAKDAIPAAYGSGLLAIGAPDFDRRSRQVAQSSSPGSAPAAAFPLAGQSRATCGDFRSLRFEPLPAAAGEAEDVAGLWKAQGSRGEGGEALEIVGAQASKSAFVAAAPGRRVLHLATHGFFLGAHCRPAIPAARGMALLDPAGAELPMGDNPLLLSGLAFAGANQRDTARPGADDGILIAEEIATLDLSGVEWAVLSGCDTGVGEIRAGEGVIGLRRAFELAGARTLIMSLWSVSDVAARRWMQALYEARFVRGLRTAEAVREASLGVLRERRSRGSSTHPFYWAAFVAAGDWR